MCVEQGVSGGVRCAQYPTQRPHAVGFCAALPPIFFHGTQTAYVKLGKIPLQTNKNVRFGGYSGWCGRVALSHA